MTFSLVFLMMAYSVGVCDEVLYIANTGSDSNSCAEGSECGSVVGAYGKKSGSATEIVLNAGSYSEASGIEIANNKLKVRGLSRSQCILSKVNDSDFVLFKLGGNSDLVISDLTVYLTNHAAGASYITTTGSGSSSGGISASFTSCTITMDTGETSILGNSIDINSRAFLGFSDCIVFNITTTGEFPVIKCNCHTLLLVNSNFINIENNNAENLGALFHAPSLENMTIKLSTFTLCQSSGMGGVGYVKELKNIGNKVESCVFWNCSAGSAGVLWAGSSSSYMINSLLIVNTSCVDCKASSGGGAFWLENYLKPLVKDCTFTRCESQSLGGAIRISHYCDVFIDGSVFLECKGNRGGAVGLIDHSNLSIEGSTFVRNKVQNCDGFDIFVSYISRVTTVTSYTDKTTPSQSIFCEYSGSSCEQLLPVDDPCTIPPSTNNDVCPIPDENLCARPHNCTDDELLVGGKCTPKCLFWKPYGFGGYCGSDCVSESSFGYPLCMRDCNSYALEHYYHLWNSCPLKPCTERTPLAGVMCGDNEHCFVSGGSCVETCPGELIPDLTTGTCRAQECEDIRYDEIACRDMDGCVIQVSGLCRTGDCAEVYPERYDMDPVTKKCVLKCIYRQPNYQSLTPCGDNNACFMTSISASHLVCVEDCGNSMQNDTSRGVCIDNRCVDWGTDEEACRGTDTCVIRNGYCVDACDDIYPDHYKIDAVTKVCELKCPFRSRTQCREDSEGKCVLREDQTCGDNCDDAFDHFYEKNDARECIRKCQFRVPLEENPIPCGDNSRCFLQAIVNHYGEAIPECVDVCLTLYSENGKCETNPALVPCLNDSHHTGQIVDGVCQLKECRARRKNDSSQYPCGSDDCYFDLICEQDELAEPGSGGVCRPYCVNDMERKASSTGNCIWRICSEATRKAAQGACEGDENEKNGGKSMRAISYWCVIVLSLISLLL